MAEARRVNHGVEKKAYVEPTLEKAQKLQDVTEGGAPLVTGAVPEV
jgi:hypothetical protein